MPSELERLEAELAAEKAAPGAPAQQDETYEPLGPVKAMGEGMVGLIPGGQAAEAKLIGMLPGQSEQGVAQEQARLGKKYPWSKAAGTVTAGVAAGPLIAGEAAVGLAGQAASALKSAGAAAAMEPIYKLGDVVNQAQAQGNPLRVEQIAHALMPDWDTLKAAGLAALFHIPGLAVAGTQAAQEAAGRQAIRSASKQFPKAAAALGVSPIDVGMLAIEKKVLENSSQIQSLREAAGQKMSSIAAATPVDMPLQEELALELDHLAQQAGANENLAAPLKFIQKQSAALTSRELNGAQVEDIIQGLNARGRQAHKAGNSQVGQLFGDAAQTLREKFGNHIELMTPDAGAEYKNAIADYRTYSKMAPEAVRGAARQATIGDLVGAASKVAAGHVAGKAIGGAPGSLVADIATGAMGLKSLGDKSYTVLLDRFSKSPPLATFLRKSDKVIDALLGKPSALYANMSKSRDMDQYYEEVSNAARASVANPEQLSQSVASRLSFLPPHEADPIVASTVNKLHEAAAQLPQNGQPATAFGIQTGPTDRQKRDFLDKFEAKFDPYKAIMSGNAELIAEADKHHPETMQAIRKKLIDRCNQPNIPYSTMRQISAILGVAGVPTQDPGMAAQLQTCIQNSRAAHSAQGQMDSARQQHAALKNNQATLSRASTLSKGLDEE